MIHFQLMLAAILLLTACKPPGEAPNNDQQPSPTRLVHPSETNQWWYIGRTNPDPAKVISAMKLRWVPGLPDGNWRITGTGGWVGVYEVTQREYLYTTGTNHSVVNDLNLPMINVSFDDANGFCRILNTERKRRNLPGRFRLPTLEQWRHFGGEEAMRSEIGIVRNLMPVAVVETLPAGDYGIAGVGGNVSEWIMDANRVLIAGGEYSSGFVPTNHVVMDRTDVQRERTGFRVVLVGDL